MPYTTTKTGGKRPFKVKAHGRVVGSTTTREKLKKYLRTLRAIEHGWRPTGRGR